MRKDCNPGCQDIKILPPFKMQVLTNFPYIEADFDAITNYQLLCKVVEYLNKVIKNENELAKGYEYILNYFNNLDLQEEVNNKLDEMAESGELEELIAQYLTLSSMITYDNVASMKLADNLVNGSKCATLGYYAVNDGGNAIYKIRNITNEDVIDEATIIALKDENLIAELIYDNINVNQFGAYGDGIHDDTQAIQKAIDKSDEYNTIEFCEKSIYLVSDTLTIPIDRNLNGNNCTIKIDESFNAGYLILYNSNSSGQAISIYPKNTSIIKNFIIHGEESNYTNNNFLMICQHVEICNIRFENINHCIYFTNDYIDRAEIHNIYINNRTGSDYAIYLGNQGDAKYIHHIQYGGAGNNVKLISCGANLVHVTIDNIVAGTLDIRSNAIIKNIMLSYYGIINITGCDATLENIQYSKNKINEYRIVVDSSGRKLPNITLKNIKGFFINNVIEYDSTPKNSILINNCNSYTLTNVYTGNRYGDSYEQTALAFEKIDFGENVINKMYNTYPIELNDKLLYAKNYSTINIGEPYLVQALSQNAIDGYFKGTAGTYYYRWASGIDVDNGFAKTSNEVSLTYSDTNKIGRILLNYSSSSHMPDRIRIYRGTSTGTYTEYADLDYCNDILIDNGVSINGIIWRNMSSDGVTYNNRDNNTVIKNMILENVGSNIYVKKYTARYNPIDNASWFANGTYQKGTLLYDYNSGLGYYLYDGSEWTKITN